MLTDGDVERLGDGEAVIVDGWLATERLLHAHTAVTGMFSRGELRPAGVGRGRDHTLDATLRGDGFAWIEPEEAPLAFAPLLESFEALRVWLNHVAFAGLRSFEMQVARYADGAAYARHRDAFRDEPNRRMTAILYLNPGWTPEDGGCLRIWPPSGEAVVHPVLGRLLLFRADLLEHEVLPSFAPRYAVTAWYR